MSKEKELEILSYIAELLVLGYVNTAKEKAIKYYDSKLGLIKSE